MDDLILRDRDADGNPATGDLGKTASGLEERLYALQDPNWNVVAIANTSGTIQERYCYDAYGKPTFLTSAFAVRNPNVSSYSWDTLYTGRQYDPETGLYDYRRRPYHSLLGRFVNRDPIGYEAKDMNLYRYCDNSPLIYTDSMGTIPIPTGRYCEYSGSFSVRQHEYKVTFGKGAGKVTRKRYSWHCYCQVACRTKHLVYVWGSLLPGCHYWPPAAPSLSVAWRYSTYLEGQGSMFSFDKTYGDYVQMCKDLGIQPESEYQWKARMDLMDVLKLDICDSICDAKKGRSP